MRDDRLLCILLQQNLKKKHATTKLYHQEVDQQVRPGNNIKDRRWSKVKEVRPEEESANRPKDGAEYGFVVPSQIDVFF